MNILSSKNIPIFPKLSLKNFHYRNNIQEMASIRHVQTEMSLSYEHFQKTRHQSDIIVNDPIYEETLQHLMSLSLK